MLKIKIPQYECTTFNEEQVSIRRPNWKKATSADRDGYSNNLNNKLSELATPDTLHCHDVTCGDPGHSHDRDGHVLNVMTRVIEASYEDIPVSENKPVGARAKKQLLGWKENVAPARHDSMFWHSIWLSCGRPNRGGLFDVMKWTRNKYHLAVWKAKIEANSLQREALANAALDGNKDLFKQMKKHLNKGNSGQDIPNSLEGKVTFDDILEKFAECYQRLYNSADTTEEMTVIKNIINDTIAVDSANQANEISRVTAKTV